MANLGYAPEEVQLLNDMGELREQLASDNNQDKKIIGGLWWSFIYQTLCV